MVTYKDWKNMLVSKEWNMEIILLGNGTEYGEIETASDCESIAESLPLDSMRSLAACSPSTCYV